MEGQNYSDNGKSQVAVVMVPFPAQGHQSPLLHLSHHVTSYGLPVHFAGPATHNHQVKLRLQGWDSETLSKIHFHDFQLPPHSSPPPNPDSSTFYPAHSESLFDASVHLREPIFRLLQELSSKYRRMVVIFDILMTSVVQDVILIPNAESYVFLVVSAFHMFFSTWEGIPNKPFQLDFDVPKCIPSKEGCYTTKVSKFIVNQKQLLGFEAGTLFNTSRLIEGKYAQLLEKLSINPDKKLFAVGPLNPLEKESKCDRHISLLWLDKQEACSVIYVSFGSATSMSDEQITELALGLERSGHKFVWVCRRADATYISLGGDVRNPLLPQGYEERVKNRGMVVTDWAPQLQILAHPSIGGFMTHCGWNSCMESISMGVPMVAWPMHSDQPRNAILVTEVLRIGILVRDWSQRADLVTSATIENISRRLMASEEGEEMRKRAAELGDAVQASVARGETSHVEMDSFFFHITR